MKHSLTLKFVLSYLVLGFIILILLGTFSPSATNRFLKQEETRSLYRETSLLANDLMDYFSKDNISIPAIQKDLEIIAGYLSCEIWITDSDGNLLIDSSDENVYLKAFSHQTIPTEGFDISDFGNTYHMTGDFYGSFSESTLTVFSPITSEYKVRGYVFMHKPMTAVLEQSTQISNFIFCAVMAAYACSSILLITYLWAVYSPLSAIRKVAKKYVRGDFSEKINIHRNDELGYVANTMNFMATELDTLEEEQRKFISNISHDFRSPLTSIKGYIEAMLDGTIPVEMQEKYLNIILFETERLNKLTQNILDLNSFRHHGLRLEITDFDINQLIRTTLPTFEGVCHKKELSFDLYLTGERLFVKGDLGKIQQVFYNLIDNATKFSNNKTAIIIETSIRNGKVLISIKDSGIGIPKESIKKIWDRFYKTDLSRGKDKRGTGLGLSIVKEIIQAHDENINVISTEDVGTEFIFTLPLSKLEQESSY